jgi:probable phosphoglycerate mutase
MKMLRLLVVRHGQTDFNAQQRYQGAIDIALNATGIHQAEALARRLRAEAIDAIVSSPLERALQTARIIAQAVPCDVQVMEHFRERGIGVYEGLTLEEVKARYSDLWGQRLTRQMNQAPPGGETILEVGARVLEGLGQLKQRHANETVLLVAHAFVARVIYGIISRVSDEQFYGYRLENGAIAEYCLS